MTDSPLFAHAIVEPVESPAAAESVLVLTVAQNEPAVLETIRSAAMCGRFSIFASDPVEVFSIPEDQDDRQASPIRRLASRIARFPALESQLENVPLAGGWIGHLTYEAGLVGGHVPRRSWGWWEPCIRFGLYDHLLVFDHFDGLWYACAIDWPDPWRARRPAVEHRLGVLRERLRAAEAVRLSPPPRPSTSTALANMTRDAYLAKVGRAIDYIEAGDIYQVNLTQRFAVRTDASPLQLYRRLRRCNPSPFAAFLQSNDAAVLSSSPELFLDVCGRRVVTRPIKGTRPRSGDTIVDSDSRRELGESEKERAELTMIVDLLRNDLGRVCEFGSIRVTDPGAIEEHPTVFHRAATIEGRLAQDKGWPDLLEAAFPGGSVTGAPKIRAMQIIRELEPTPRGVYCGSIGWIGLDGNMSLNLAIRTMVQRGDAVWAYAGGAIVAESDPRREYEEIQAKAAGMFSALNVKQSRRRGALPRRREVSAA